MNVILCIMAALYDNQSLGMHAFMILNAFMITYMVIFIKTDLGIQMIQKLSYISLNLLFCCIQSSGEATTASCMRYLLKRSTLSKLRPHVRPRYQMDNWPKSVLRLRWHMSSHWLTVLGKENLQQISP